jgi:predicted CXXCH cytochrome family protein
MGVTVQFRGLLLVIWLLWSAAATVCFSATDVWAGDYLNSAHGNTTYGVDSVAAGFARGNCAHCHEQHADPVTGAKEYLLFDYSNSSQAVNFCFDCHTSAGSYQTVANRSYSFRAGGWNLSPVTDVKFAFGQNSSHNLADIVSFVAGNPPSWANNKYTANSNACAVCHDPHLVKGDPPNSSGTAKSGSGSPRPGVITEVDSVSVPVNLWGDVVGETMSSYPGNYVDPYRVGKASYEPAGSLVQVNGADLPDYVRFCSKCHDNNNFAGTGVNSTFLGVVTNIDWPNGDKHGQVAADVEIQMLVNPGQSPYNSGPPGAGYVLSCLDCHEPHGSASQFLLRGEVNGVATGVITGGAFGPFCAQCHNPQPGASINDWEDVHHSGVDAPYTPTSPCTSCHVIGTNRIDCSTCHFHGAVTGSGGVLETTIAPLGRKTF